MKIFVMGPNHKIILAELLTRSGYPVHSLWINSHIWAFDHGFHKDTGQFITFIHEPGKVPSTFEIASSLVVDLCVSTGGFDAEIDTDLDEIPGYTPIPIHNLN